VAEGTIDQLDAALQYDAILYIDVLEHIEDDAGEVRNAVRRLRPGGRLIILAPAHQYLYSAFDKAIGHYRRYNLARLRELTPEGSVVAGAFMLDSAGFFASLANRLITRSAMPTAAQIRFWDRMLVPIARATDPLTLHRFGKTAVIVWSPALG
jgi:SAM-dependent methyltransferase